MTAPPRTPKVVCETTRERETFNSVTCSDGTLTALAQLAACQTGADRSLISLFDQTHQYIITEATPTLPLIPSLPQSGHDETLWLCGTAIPRAHGVCDYTLCEAETDQYDQPNDSDKLPMVIVDDLTEDPRFMTRPYCQPGSPARFYAATPITTRRGINIGVFCVIHTEPITNWTESQSDLMRNLSRIIMGHLEASRLKSIQARNERITRGLGSFLEGKRTLSPELGVKKAGIFNTNRELLRGGDDGTANQRDPPVSEQKAEPDSKPEEYLRKGAPEMPHESPPDVILPQEPPYSKMDEESKLDPETIFPRAANIIRESIDIEGCLFIDASSQTFTGASPNQANETKTGSGTNQSIKCGCITDDEDEDISSPDRSWPPCQVLGFSSSDQPGIHTSYSSTSTKSLPKKFLARLLRRYPKGHIFNFNANRELQRSESTDEDVQWWLVPDASKQSATQRCENPSKCNGATGRQQGGARARKDEGRVLLETFPGARSVAFVPIWNPKKERWSVGAFAYTSNPARIFTLEGDLNYLRAFGILAATEQLRLETVMADKAKADALGSLSHELRSPLHGIILGVELLNDTNLNALQENLAHTIETCCRTLTDTVDHLLDYSKINNFMGKEKILRRDSAPRGLRPDSDQSIEAGMQVLYKDTRLDILVEEVMESVSAGFNFQHLSIAQLSRKRATRFSHTDNTAIRRLDSARAMEDLGPTLTQKGEVQVKFGEVTIVLMINPSLSWAFHTQPGAIRRIAMNLFGNALKYTHRGLIKVSLEQGPSGTSSSERLVNLTVADTGVGISDDFLQNGLYKAFSQENQLAPGTGLGLSLVKQIVGQLNGHIAVSSQIGVGTTVLVSLPLTPVMSLPESPLEPSEIEKTFQAQMRELAGLRAQIVGFNKQRTPEDLSSTDSPGLSAHPLVQRICRDWLNMQVNAELETQQLAPDVVIWSEDSLPSSLDPDGPLANVPSVVICTNELIAYQYTTGSKKAGRLGVSEFISQPIGPLKLARTISQVLKRWTEAQVNPISFNVTNTPDNLGPLTPRSPISPPHSLGITESLDQSAGYFACPEFLLVDDNNINLKILASYVHKIGRLYSTATNGQEAVDAFETNVGQYKCILMDISMPVMDGFEATRRIRAMEQKAQLKPTLILALSGLASEEAQKEAFSSGVDLFLTKPVRLKELGAILKSKGILNDL
ncbi:hypothetical protein G7Z17_g7341 [Cylindrodendrum hubeiense]|uniref:histidine kinase n=1 Tax=Cylindrodendrum hubeiense TaxID=595255 RepID=A0A9P5H3W5_9HYPO|nr:hypothetical protein G7Z17_g7341 [Cylindrodendrum hubeiense]